MEASAQSGRKQIKRPFILFMERPLQIDKLPKNRITTIIL